MTDDRHDSTPSDTPHLSSMLAVPSFGSEGKIAVGLWAAMTNAPRVWTPEEVSLVETVATLTRTAVEAARIADLLSSSEARQAKSKC